MLKVMLHDYDSWRLGFILEKQNALEKNIIVWKLQLIIDTRPLHKHRVPFSSTSFPRQH